MSFWMVAAFIPRRLPAVRSGRTLPIVVSLLLPLQSLAAAGIPQGSRPPNAPVVTVNAVRPVVNGSKNPELLSDESAIRLFISSWSSAVARSDQSFETVTSRLSLGRADSRILRTEMERVHQALAEVEAQMKSSGTPAVLREALERREAIVLDAYGRLLEAFSKGGGRSLREHVKYMKTRTMQYGPQEATPDLTALRLVLLRLVDSRPEPLLARLKLGADDSALLLSEAQRFKESILDRQVRGMLESPARRALESGAEPASVVSLLQQANAEKFADSRPARRGAQSAHGTAHQGRQRKARIVSERGAEERRAGMSERDRCPLARIHAS